MSLKYAVQLNIILTILTSTQKWHSIILITGYKWYILGASRTCECTLLHVEPAGPDRNAAGGRQSHPPRQHRAGKLRGGANLPTTVEKPQ